MPTDNRTNEPNKYAGFLARQKHLRDPWRGVGVKCVCGKVFDLDADHALHQVEEILCAALVAAAEVAPAVQQVSDALALVEDVIAIHADRIGTHYEDCYKYHVACLAVEVKHRLGSEGR